MKRAKQLLTAGEKGISILFIPPSSGSSAAAFRTLLTTIHSRHRHDRTLHFYSVEDKLLSSQLLAAMQLKAGGGGVGYVVAYRSHKGKYAVLEGGGGGKQALDVGRVESWLDEVAGGGATWKKVDLSKIKDYL